jgi:hypothetical protein
MQQIHKTQQLKPQKNLKKKFLPKILHKVTLEDILTIEKQQEMQNLTPTQIQ